jgi:hypothetical protein
MLRIDQILDRIDTSQMYMFDRDDFLLYCDYMILGTPIPPDITIQHYYRTLYRYIEMMYKKQFEIHSSL